MVALNYLDTPVMISVSAGWLAGPTFANVAALKPLLPAVGAAHDELVRAQPAAAAVTSPDVAAISAAEKALDVRHDHVARALHYAALALEEYLLSLDPPEEAEAQAVADAMARVMPAALGTTQATYLAEEGYAKQADALVAADAGLAATLGRVVVAKKVGGAELLATWVEVGSALGDAEREKSKLLAAEAGAPAQATGTERKARAAWMTIVETVLSVLRHVDGDAADAIRRSVTEPAEAAAKKARAARRAAAKAAKAPEPT